MADKMTKTDGTCTLHRCVSCGVEIGGGSGEGGSEPLSLLWGSRGCCCEGKLWLWDWHWGRQWGGQKPAVVVVVRGSCGCCCEGGHGCCCGGKLWLSSWFTWGWHGNYPPHLRTPEEHPLGWSPPAYKVATVDMHCIQMCVLWGWHWARQSGGQKHAIIIVVRGSRGCHPDSHGADMATIPHTWVPPTNTHGAGHHLYMRWQP